MNLGFRDAELALHSFRSEEEVQTFLSLCERTVVLGDDSEGVISAYGVSVSLGGKKDRELRIVIRSETHGLAPSLLLRPGVRELWFGFNRSVVSLLIPTLETRFRTSLPTLFYQFIDRPGKPTVVLTEANVLLLSDDGKVIRSIATDLITNWWIQDDTLFMETMDQGPRAVSLAGGVGA